MKVHGREPHDRRYLAEVEGVLRLEASRPVQALISGCAPQLVLLETVISSRGVGSVCSMAVVGNCKLVSESKKEDFDDMGHLR